MRRRVKLDIVYSYVFFKSDHFNKLYVNIDDRIFYCERVNTLVSTTVIYTLVCTYLI